MSHRLYLLGRFCARRPWTVIGAWLVAAVLVVGASGTVGKTLEDSFQAPGVDSQRAARLLDAAGSDRAGLTAQVVVTPREAGTTFFDSPAARAELSRVRASVTASPKVLGASDPVAALDAGRAAAVRGRAVSPDGRVALVRVQYPVLERLRAEDLDALKEVGARIDAGSPLRVEMGGDLFFAFEEPESGTAELVGVGAAAIILLVAFGSVVAMGLPIGIALLGLALGVSSMSLVAYLVDIPSWAPQIAGMVGLGVGIDYALFLVTRHREGLARGLVMEESIGRAVATAGQVVIFAGGTVVIAILGLAVAGIPAITAAGIAIATVVLVMVLASITLLPALLGVAGTWIDRLTLRRRPRAAAGAAPGARWARWGGHVTRWRWSYAVGVTLLLLGLSAPVLALQMGSPSEGTLPETRTERRAHDLAAAGFGPGVHAPLVVAIDTAGDPGAVDALRRGVAADAGVDVVAPAEVDPASGVATLVAFPTSGPEDAETRATIARLRAEVIAPTLAGSPARAHLGGATASFVDTSDRVSDRLVPFVAAVLLLSFLLLVLVFRSLVVPLKAVLMNLLSIGAAYGVLVMVFQWGWGLGLIGLETTVPILSFLPLFMFAILFGLSMDYEVFLLSRVREEHLHGAETTTAVVRGIAGTARVITSAALIMICVFLGFVLSDDPTTKMFGLGLATAILIDATIVRLVLVPAAMSLLGDANWWMPRWLDRALPAFDLDPHLEAPTVAAPGGLASGDLEVQTEQGDATPVLVRR